MNRLEVKVDGNTTGFKHAMDTVRTQAKATAEHVSSSWKEGIVGGIIGAFSFEAVKGAVESFIANAKGVKDMAEQLEMSTDATQKWAKAADEVGTSLGNIYSTLSAIQSKRQEALRDPKAADLFSAMGISRANVLSEDSSDFAKRVLMAGGENKENRRLLEQIVGRRGLKLIPASNVFDKAKVDFDGDAIKAADEAEKAEKRASSAIGRAIGAVFSWVFSSVDIMKKNGDEAVARVNSGDEKGGLLWRFLHRHDGAEVMEQQSQERIRKLFGLPEKPTEPTTPSQAEAPPEEDPLEGVKNQQSKEFDLQNQEALMGLHEAKRRNMTIAGRKASIKKDLDDLNKEINDREDAVVFGHVYGMTEKQSNEMLPTEREKQMHDDYLKLIGLKTKREGFTNQLRDSKGFSFEADSMARVGLYSSSTLRINPMLQLQEKQLNAILSVERAVRETATRDPHRR